MNEQNLIAEAMRLLQSFENAETEQGSNNAPSVNFERHDGLTHSMTRLTDIFREDEEDEEIEERVEERNEEETNEAQVVEVNKEEENLELNSLLNVVEQFYEYEIDSEGSIIIYVDHRICANESGDTTPIIDFFIKIKKDGSIWGRRMTFTAIQVSKGFIHPHLTSNGLKDWKYEFCFGNYSVRTHNQTETLKNLLPIFERFLQTEEGRPYCYIGNLKGAGMERVGYAYDELQTFFLKAKGLFKVKIINSNNSYNFSLVYSEEFDKLLEKNNIVSFKTNGGFFRKVSGLGSEIKIEKSITQKFKDRVYEFKIIPDDFYEQKLTPTPCEFFKQRFEIFVNNQLVKLINDKVKNNTTGSYEHSEDLPEILF